MHRALARASVSILPPLIREKLQLGKEFDLTTIDRWMLKAAGKLAETIPVKSSPACQASIRLGLPWKFPYLSQSAQAKALAAAGMAASHPLAQAAE
jgi:uncharacterized protein (DUF2236 family)